MAQVVIFGDNTLDIQGLQAILREQGYQSIVLPGAQVEGWGEGVALVFLDVPYLSRAKVEVDSLIHRCRQIKGATLLALLAPDNPADFRLVKMVDDFITYPYNRHEVVARVQNLLGEAGAAGTEPDSKGSNLLVRGPLVIDGERYEVRVGSRKINLTYKEYELLRFLASSPGKVFPREVLLDRVWGYNYFGGTRTVDMHVKRLRSKIGIEGYTFIETVRGVGYRFASQR